jgi:hypothetical protein
MKDRNTLEDIIVIISVILWVFAIAVAVLTLLDTIRRTKKSSAQPRPR